MEQKKQVLIVGPTDLNGRAVGGIGSLLSAIFDNQEMFFKFGYEVSPFNTCLVKRDSNGAGKFNFKNVINFLKLRQKLKKTCKNNNFCVVDIHSSVGNGLLKDLLLAKRIRKIVPKIVFHIHSSDPGVIFPHNSFLRKFVLKTIRNCCDAIVLLSSSIKSELVSNGIDSDKCFVIPNFVSISVSKDQILKKIEVRQASNSLNLIYLGAIYKEKGVFDLLTSLEKISIPYKMRICGSPVSEKDKKTLVSFCEKNKNIEFLGFVSGTKKYDVLLDSDVMILPSYSEGLPMSLIEGITCGCYLLTTNVGGIPEFFSDAGIIVNPGDCSTISNSILSIYKNKEKLGKFQMRNYELSSRFSKEEFISSLCSVFSK